MEYFVDFQAFNIPTHKFAIKELSILPLEGQPITYLFKPPYDWNFLPAKYKAVNLWLEKNYHHLKWDTGVFEYADLEDVLLLHLSDAKAIYVKGLEKKNF